jgi:hypothetical protein
LNRPVAGPARLSRFPLLYKAEHSGNIQATFTGNI